MANTAARDLTSERIQDMLRFAQRIRDARSSGDLPAHLAARERELLGELMRRQGY